MVVHGSIRRGLAVAGAVVALAAGVAESAQAAVYENPHAPTFVRVKDLMRRMTLQEKIGQMTQAERDSVTDDTTPDHAVQPRQPSSRAAGRCRRRTRRRRGPTWSTASSAPRWPRGCTSRCCTASTRVHGDGNMLGATVFPHNIGLGATRDPSLVGDVEHVTAEETRASGSAVDASRPASAPRATTAGAAPTRASARTRGLVDADGDRDRRLPGPARAPVRQRPRARDGQALRRRRRHRVRHAAAATTRSTRASRSPTAQDFCEQRPDASTSPAVQRPRRRQR